MDKSERLDEWDWAGMPDFKQEKVEPFSKIVFRFETEEDLNEFSELIGQKLTPKTKSAWHPYKPHRKTNKREWVVDVEQGMEDLFE